MDVERTAVSLQACRNVSNVTSVRLNLTQFRRLKLTAASSHFGD